VRQARGDLRHGGTRDGHLGARVEDDGALPRGPFEYDVTVCDANEACPVFPGERERLHWSFEDPSRAEGEGEVRLAVFRWVRHEVLARVEAEFASAN
jgi:hypothetical protein